MLLELLIITAVFGTQSYFLQLVFAESQSRRKQKLSTNPNGHMFSDGKLN